MSYTKTYHGLQEEVQPNLQALLSHILNSSQKLGYCFQSVDTLSASLNKSERTIQRQIVELEAKGFIELSRHKKYQTHVCKPTALAKSFEIKSERTRRERDALKASKDGQPTIKKLRCDLSIGLSYLKRAGLSELSLERVKKEVDASINANADARIHEIWVTAQALRR